MGSGTSYSGIVGIHTLCLIIRCEFKGSEEDKCNSSPYRHDVL